MRNLERRLHTIEQQVPDWQDDEVDVKQALNFRVAGMPRCAAQARMIVALDYLARRPGHSDDNAEQCRMRIAQIIPAFEFETTYHSDDPRLQDDDHRFVMQAAWKIIREFGADSGS